MKRNFSMLLAVIFASLAFMSSCGDSIIEKRIYTANIPVYMTLAEFRSSLTVESADNVPLSNPGKMFITDKYLFINELFEGVHVFDNSNPADPKKIKFIRIPGNVDITITGNILYADSYIDLVMIDIADIENIKEVNRIENVFTQIYPDCNEEYLVQQPEPGKGIVIGWTVEEIEEEVEMNNPIFWIRGGDFIAMNTMEKAVSSPSSDASVGGSNAIGNSGKGGSMARFITYKNYLYTLNPNNLLVFDISVREFPVQRNNINTWWDAETVFIYKENLFVGTASGMLVFSLQNPEAPQYFSGLSHMRSCDPVVVEGNTAYVTLRGGTTCGGMLNQLDVIDITNLQQPNLMKSYSMTGPYGLGVENGILFICDGDDGLKVFDAADPYNVKQLYHFDNINAYDVIPMNGILLMIGKDGFYQYDFTDAKNMTLLSVIPVDKNN